MKNRLLLTLLAVLFLANAHVFGQVPVVQWSFENIQNRKVAELNKGVLDTLEGNYSTAPGVRGQGIRLDGFTTCIKSVKNNQANSPGKEMSIEAWVALGNYPWNWCPVLTSESDQVDGYRLQIGPLGQASFECAVEGQWMVCLSAQEAMPLRQWMHLVGVYSEEKMLELFINGELIATTDIHGKLNRPKAGYVLGMVRVPGKPSDIHRTWGTLPAFYGLDGIMDEVSIYNIALTPGMVMNRYQAIQPGLPDIQPRRLPTIAHNPGLFGAFYTKLKYYPGWDNLWPVDQDPDIVVCFDLSPVKVVFWRGTRYEPSWISENENWMSDQSVEAWGVGEADKEGCFEHMQDRHCRFSQVRIIENNKARVVVHWRYAPVSAYDHTWRPDPKTGWECWIDEYYYIYPDASAVRKVSWKKGTLGFPRQFQESLAFIQPGQVVSDLLNKDFAWVADYEGNRGKESFVDHPDQPPYGPFDWNKSSSYTIQQFNFKSDNKPFICFEPGNKMWIRNEGMSSYNRASGCNHFPVGQARCDGRTTRMSDRPSHCTSFPISDPVIHENGDRFYWNGLYGINDMNLDELIELGKSWAYPPELVIHSNGYSSSGYDKSERCYQLVYSGENSGKLKIELMGSKNTPIINPAFVIKNWVGEVEKVLINQWKSTTVRFDYRYELSGTDLIIFLPLKSQSPTTISILSKT